MNLSLAFIFDFLSLKGSGSREGKRRKHLMIGRALERKHFARRAHLYPDMLTSMNEVLWRRRPFLTLTKIDVPSGIVTCLDKGILLDYFSKNSGSSSVPKAETNALS